MKKKWTLEEALKLKEEKKYKSWQELEQIYGKNIRRTYRRLKKRYPELNDNNVVDDSEIEELKVGLRKADWRKILSQGQMNAELNKEISGIKNEFVVDKYKDYPYPYFPVMFTADWHIGNTWTDYEAFLQFMEFIITNQIKLSVVGDMIDNFILDNLKFPMLNTSLTPRQQKIALLNLLDELLRNDCLLNLCLGNHDLRSERAIGETIFSFFDLKVPVSHNRTVMELKFNDVSYKILEVHKALGFSIYNKLHAGQRELRWHHPDADVIVLAHKHTPAILHDYNFRKWQWIVMVGTFQKHSEYIYDYWDKAATIYNPIFLFGTKEKKIKLVEYFEDFKKFTKGEESE